MSHAEGVAGLYAPLARSAPDLPHLTDREQQVIMEVLHRDEELRRQDQLRVMRLKAELQELRRKGALRPADWPSQDIGPGARVCARCRAELGRIINRGAFCRACRLRVCKACREYTSTSHEWVCTVCHKHMEIQAASGEWMNEYIRRPSRRRDNRVYVPPSDIIKRSIRRSWTISNPSPRWSTFRGSLDFQGYNSLPRHHDSCPVYLRDENSPPIHRRSDIFKFHEELRKPSFHSHYEKHGNRNSLISSPPLPFEHQELRSAPPFYCDPATLSMTRHRRQLFASLGSEKEIMDHGSSSQPLREQCLPRYDRIDCEESLLEHPGDSPSLMNQEIRELTPPRMSQEALTNDIGVHEHSPIGRRYPSFDVMESRSGGRSNPLLQKHSATEMDSAVPSSTLQQHCFVIGQDSPVFQKRNPLIARDNLMTGIPQQHSLVGQEYASSPLEYCGNSDSGGEIVATPPTASRRFGGGRRDDNTTSPRPEGSPASVRASSGEDLDTEPNMDTVFRKVTVKKRHKEMRRVLDSGANSGRRRSTRVTESLRVTEVCRRLTSTLEEQQQHEYFLDASRILQPEGDDYKLVFISSDSSSKEEEECSQSDDADADSSSTSSSATGGISGFTVEDCDWDYFESSSILRPVLRDWSWNSQGNSSKTDLDDQSNFMKDYESPSMSRKLLYSPRNNSDTVDYANLTQQRSGSKNNYDSGYSLRKRNIGDFSHSPGDSFLCRRRNNSVERMDTSSSSSLVHEDNASYMCPKTPRRYHYFPREESAGRFSSGDRSLEEVTFCDHFCYGCPRLENGGSFDIGSGDNVRTSEALQMKRDLGVSHQLDTVRQSPSSVLPTTTVVATTTIVSTTDTPSHKWCQQQQQQQQFADRDKEISNRRVSNLNVNCETCGCNNNNNSDITVAVPVPLPIPVPVPIPVPIPAALWSPLTVCTDHEMQVSSSSSTTAAAGATNNTTSLSIADIVYLNADDNEENNTPTNNNNNGGSVRIRIRSFQRPPSVSHVVVGPWCNWPILSGESGVSNINNSNNNSSNTSEANRFLSPFITSTTTAAAAGTSDQHFMKISSNEECGVLGNIAPGDNSDKNLSLDIAVELTNSVQNSDMIKAVEKSSESGVGREVEGENRRGMINDDQCRKLHEEDEDEDEIKISSSVTTMEAISEDSGLEISTGNSSGDEIVRGNAISKQHAGDICVAHTQLQEDNVVVPHSTTMETTTTAVIEPINTGTAAAATIKKTAAQATTIGCTTTATTTTGTEVPTTGTMQIEAIGTTAITTAVTTDMSTMVTIEPTEAEVTTQTGDVVLQNNPVINENNKLIIIEDEEVSLYSLLPKEIISSTSSSDCDTDVENTEPVSRTYYLTCDDGSVNNDDDSVDDDDCDSGDDSRDDDSGGEDGSFSRVFIVNSGVSSEDEDFVGSSSSSDDNEVELPVNNDDDDLNIGGVVLLSHTNVMSDESLCMDRKMENESQEMNEEREVNGNNNILLKYNESETVYSLSSSSTITATTDSPCEIGNDCLSLAEKIMDGGGGGGDDLSLADNISENSEGIIVLNYVPLSDVDSNKDADDDINRYNTDQIINDDDGENESILHPLNSEDKNEINDISECYHPKCVIDFDKTDNDNGKAELKNDNVRLENKRPDENREGENNMMNDNTGDILLINNDDECEKDNMTVSDELIMGDHDMKEEERNVEKYAPADDSETDNALRTFEEESVIIIDNLEIEKDVEEENVSEGNVTMVKDVVELNTDDDTNIDEIFTINDDIWEHRPSNLVPTVVEQVSAASAAVASGTGELDDEGVMSSVECGIQSVSEHNKLYGAACPGIPAEQRYTSLVMITQDNNNHQKEEEQQQASKNEHQQESVVSVVTTETTTVVPDYSDVIVKHTNWGENEKYRTDNNNGGLAGYFTLTLETSGISPSTRRPLVTKSVRKDVDIDDKGDQESEAHRKEEGEEKEEADDDHDDDVRVVTGGDTLSAVVCLEEGIADDDSWVEENDRLDEDDFATTTPTEEEEEEEEASSGEDGNTVSASSSVITTTYMDREADLRGYNRVAIDFTLHTIVEESCEESEIEHSNEDGGSGGKGKKSRPTSASELEKYFFFGLGGGMSNSPNSREIDTFSDTGSSIYSEGLESLSTDDVIREDYNDDDIDPAELASSRLEKYFLTGFMGFNTDNNRDSDGSGSVGSDSEGKPSPEQRRKKLVRARGTGRQHSSSLDNLVTSELSGTEQTAEQQLESEDSSSTETDMHDDVTLTNFEKSDGQFDTVKRKKKKRTLPSTGSSSPAMPDLEKKAASMETLTDLTPTAVEEQNLGEDSLSTDGEEDGSKTPQPEFLLSSDLSSTRNKQQSRDSGFIGSCDDLLKEQRSSSDSSSCSTSNDQITTTATTATTATKLDFNTEVMEQFNTTEMKTVLKIDENALTKDDGREQCNNEEKNVHSQNITPASPSTSSTPPATGLTRKDSFNNWSSDEETNLMMSKMRAFFKTMVAASGNNSSNNNSNNNNINSIQKTPQASPSMKPRVPGTKPPQLIYFESELTRLMKTVPGIRDDQVREIVEYLSSEDTWSDSYDSSDYTSSDLEGTSAYYQHAMKSNTGKSDIQEQISASCQQIISKFDTSMEEDEQQKQADENEEEDDEDNDNSGKERVDRNKIRKKRTNDEKYLMNNKDTAFVYQRLVASFSKMATGEHSTTSSDTNSTPHSSPPLIAKVMHHIGSRLVALMHEVSGGERGITTSSPKVKYHYHRRLQQKVSSTSTTTEEEEDSHTDTEPEVNQKNTGISEEDLTSNSTYNHLPLPRSKSHDLLIDQEGRHYGYCPPQQKESLRSSSSGVSDIAEERETSDYERFSWRGSFESALMAADSRTKLSLLACGNDTSLPALAAKRRSAGDLLFAASSTKSCSREQLDRVRSCGSIGGGSSNIEDKIWGTSRSHGRRRSSVPDATNNVGSVSGASADDDEENDDDNDAAADIEDDDDDRDCDLHSGKSTTLPRSLQTSCSAGTNSLPRLPTSSTTSTAISPNIYKAHSMHHFLQNNVKSARYRPPGFNRTSAPKRAVSAPGLQPLHPRREAASRRRLQPSPQSNDDASISEELPSTSVSQPPLSKSASPSPIVGGVCSRKASGSVSSGEWPGQEEDIDQLVAIHQRNSSLGNVSTEHASENVQTSARNVVTSGESEVESIGAELPSIFSRRSSAPPRSDSMASVYSGAEGRYGTVVVRGEVEFGLQYNYKAGALEIHVKQCRDLAPVDLKRNRSDPYVKVYLLPDKSKSGKRKTKVKKHTLNPVFDETLKFHMTLHGLETRTLWLTVWHSDMFGRNDFLGEVMMALGNKVFDDPTPQWYQLQERTEPFDDLLSYKGDIIIGLKFVPPDVTVSKKGKRSRGSLHVLVKEAKNLTAVKANGTSDPFCKSYLLPDKGRSSKQKTPVLRRSCNPVWNYTFVYEDVSLQELSERSLELTVWDHDRLASNEFLGGLRFNLGTGKHYGKNVDWMDAGGKEMTLWQSMLERPNFWVEGCLTLRASLEQHRSSSS